MIFFSDATTAVQIGRLLLTDFNRLFMNLLIFSFHKATSTAARTSQTHLGMLSYLNFVLHQDDAH